MGTLSRICVALATFLLIAGVVYGVTSHEPAGTTALLIASATFWFLALVARHVARTTPAGAEGEAAEVHVAPTIWPLGFAISAVILALGLVLSPWILIPGAVGFVLCAAGWLRDVARSHVGAG